MNHQETILIAGGAGFLGSHLVDRCLAQGADVWVLDNLQTGHLSNLSQAQEAFPQRLTIIQQDVLDPLPSDLPRFDRIANLACAASPPHYQRNPVHTLLTNVQGTHRLLQRAQQDQAVFLQASTSEVYGDPLIHPQAESDWGHVNPTGPRACYDEGKRAAEALCFDYHRQFGTAIKVARIFNTYGPRMAPDDGRVVSQFITQALSGQPLTVYGTGQQTRSLCYVSDLLDGLMALWTQTPTHVTGPVNLGNDLEITVLALARFILQEIGSQAEMTYHALPVDDPRQRCPDLTLSKKVLAGWSPQTPWPVGIRQTIDYFRQLGQLLKP